MPPFKQNTRFEINLVYSSFATLALLFWCDVQRLCIIKNVENKHDFLTAKRCAMQAKSEVTIKLSGLLPTAKPAPNKKV